MAARWLPLARRDLSDAVDYLATHNLYAGFDLVAATYDAVDLLIAHPLLGRHCGNDVRTWPLPKVPYKIVYRVALRDIEILRLLHWRRTP